MTTYTNTRNGNLAELIEKTETGATMKMIETGETVNIGIPTSNAGGNSFPRPKKPLSLALPVNRKKNSRPQRS